MCMSRYNIFLCIIFLVNLFQELIRTRRNTFGAYKLLLGFLNFTFSCNIYHTSYMMNLHYLSKHTCSSFTYVTRSDKKGLIAFPLFQLWEFITFLLNGFLQWYLRTKQHHHRWIVCENFKQISVTIMKLQKHKTV